MTLIAWYYSRTSVCSAVKTDRVAELGPEGRRHRKPTKLRKSVKARTIGLAGLTRPDLGGN
jgi:hypothetical protein